MQVRRLACGFVLGVATAWAGGVALSQGQGGSGGAGSSGGGQPGGAGAAAGGQVMPSPEDMQAMMEAWEKSMKPGDHHKALNASIGTWDGKFKMIGGPDMPPMESDIVAERKWVLNGRFVQETITGSMPMPDMATGAMKQVDWEGMGLTGYDNYRNMYVGCWADNMGTQLLTFKGAASPDGKTITFYGEMDEPMLGVVGRTVKYVTRIQDEDHQTFTIYDLHAGDDYKVIEISLTRRKN